MENINNLNQHNKLAWLTSFSFLASSKINSILKSGIKPEDIYKNPSLICKYIEEKEVNALIENANENYLNNYLKNLNDKAINFLSVYCNLSEKLTRIFSECGLYFIFFKGDINIINSKCLAVVGSRACDAYGKRVTEDFVNPIALSGITIVSGLATGVDSYAQKTCLDANGKTIAVLGGGFNKIYPAYNTNLANLIVQKGGLLISEHAPFVMPLTYFFPLRNRIIASLSEAVLITQMGRKSGALHTKNFALEYNKELFVVVSDVYKEYNLGNIDTIAQFPSSATVNPIRILDFFGVNLKTENIEKLTLSLEEQLIINSLKSGEKSFDSLISLTKLSINKLLSLLTSLKINGIIKQLPNNIYSL